jgi:hypothetical protein
MSDDLVERLRAEIALQQGDAAAWGVDTYGDLPRYLALLDEAATLITSLREALEEATKLNNKYAWERDKAREERDQAERKAEAFWKPQVERLEMALNPSRKETI